MGLLHLSLDLAARSRVEHDLVSPFAEFKDEILAGTLGAVDPREVGERRHRLAVDLVEQSAHSGIGVKAQPSENSLASGRVDLQPIEL